MGAGGGAGGEEAGEEGGGGSDRVMGGFVCVWEWDRIVGKIEGKEKTLICWVMAD